ncbi:hypothetical protein BT93_C2244 [Corymbia citriodora subsp. variegata]|nr:hypothetical protein BT93_C2244 [Corymbia citriodora subsp. variegata]
MAVLIRSMLGEGSGSGDFGLASFSSLVSRVEGGEGEDALPQRVVMASAGPAIPSPSSPSTSSRNACAVLAPTDALFPAWSEFPHAGRGGRSFRARQSRRTARLAPEEEKLIRRNPLDFPITSCFGEEKCG